MHSLHAQMRVDTADSLTDAELAKATTTARRVLAAQRLILSAIDTPSKPSAKPAVSGTISTPAPVSPGSIFAPKLPTAKDNEDDRAG